MGYHFPKILEPPGDDVIAVCSKCNGEIYVGEEYATDGYRAIRPECVDAEFVALPLWAKTQLLGLELKGGGVYAFNC